MRFGLGFFCLAFGCGVSAAQTSVTQSEMLDIYYYEVSGLSPEHLIESFRNRPDPTVMATTRSGVDIRYEFAFGQGECRLVQIDLMLDIDITYPRWREEAQGSASMQAEWTRFMAAVEAHEHGHVERFRATVTNLSDGLAAIPPAVSCDTVRTAVDQLGEQFDRDLEAAQAAYERETSNGATQGARLRFR